MGMKKSGTTHTMVLLVLLLVVGVLAVLAVHDSGLQGDIKLFLEGIWEKISQVCRDAWNYFLGA